MTNISNSFAYDFCQLPSKYTISTLQSVDIADNQHSCGCILKLSRFPLETPCGLMLYIGGERLPNRRLPSNVHAKIAKFSELPAMIA